MRSDERRYKSAMVHSLSRAWTKKLKQKRNKASRKAGKYEAKCQGEDR